MNYLDIIIAIPLLWGAFIGFKKGFIIEVATLLGIGLGIYGASEFSNYLGEWMAEKMDWSPTLIEITAFIIIFLGIVIVVNLIGKAMEKLIKLAALGLFNRIAGCFFGILKYTLLLALLIYMLEKINARYEFINPELRNESLLYVPVSEIIPTIYPRFEAFSAQVAQD